MVKRLNTTDTPINDEIRYRLFKLVEARPDISQRELASAMGVSLGKLNYCLKALIDVGLVKVGNFGRSNHKLGYVYLITPKGVAEKARITSRFLAKKEMEYKLLKSEIEMLRKETQAAQLDEEIYPSLTKESAGGIG